MEYKIIYIFSLIFVLIGMILGICIGISSRILYTVTASNNYMAEMIYNGCNAVYYFTYNFIGFTLTSILIFIFGYLGKTFIINYLIISISAYKIFKDGIIIIFNGGLLGVVNFLIYVILFGLIYLAYLSMLITCSYRLSISCKYRKCEAISIGEWLLIYLTFIFLIFIVSLLFSVILKFIF